METAATAEEESELKVLREQVAADGRELGETVAALAGRLAEAGNLRLRARGTATAVVSRARQAARQAVTRAGRFGPKVAMTTGILVVAAVAVSWQHRRRG
jgi:hypothetical protein